MAINQNQSSIAFVQCLFAIECILQDQEGFITKSVTSPISEYAAFMVGSDKESRIEIESLFKNLYAIRSKIAHGTNVDSITSELSEAIWLSKQIIVNFLIKPELKAVDHIKGIRNYITEFRYS